MEPGSDPDIYKILYTFNKNYFCINIFWLQILNLNFFLYIIK